MGDPLTKADCMPNNRDDVFLRTESGFFNFLQVEAYIFVINGLSLVAN